MSPLLELVLCRPFGPFRDSKGKSELADRFRLIYLKSTGAERSALDESSAVRAGEILKSVLPAAQGSPVKTTSSQVVLKQARTDLKHSDPKVRILAIQYLGQRDASIAIPLIQEVLSDRDPDVRAEGLHSLMKFEDPVASALLKKHLKDPDPKVRLAALRGMFKHGERVDSNLLLQFLSDGSPLVRRKLATLLGWTRLEGIFPTLVELAKDEDPQVRKAALSSLLTLYPEESEDRMLEAMTDPDPDLRKWAREVLEKIAASPLKEAPPRQKHDGKHL